MNEKRAGFIIGNILITEPTHLRVVSMTGIENFNKAMVGLLLIIEQS
jgi:hypothetical protein